MASSKRLPPIHPGEILFEEFMKPLGISINGLARELAVPPGGSAATKPCSSSATSGSD